MNRHIVVMISKSRLGEFADRVAHILGFSSVRGSSEKGGRKAMHLLIDILNKGSHSAGMLADGPKGPPRVFKMGTVKMARETGKPIIPVMYGAKRKVVLKTWDHYILPMPFTDIVVFFGNPIFVAPDAGNEECERIRVESECIMNEMADACDTHWGGLPVNKTG